MSESSKDLHRHHRLDPLLRTATDEFDVWWRLKAEESQLADKITEPLFHYTDAAGFKGIVGNQELWFTSLFHVNDPSEHAYGISLAIDELRKCAATASLPIKLMCESLADKLADNKLRNVFGFFVACLSREGDDLGQWRAYGDNGRGYAIGFAPSLFEAQPDSPKLSPNERIFVSPVIYGEQEARARIHEAVEQATSVVLSTLDKPEVRALNERDREGYWFIQAMAMELCIPLIWTSLIAKHPAYENEREVRLIILGGLDYTGLPIDTRVRNGELIPYIKGPISTQTPGDVTKIMVGPATGANAADGAARFLASVGLDAEALICHSKIPYRVL